MALSVAVLAGAAAGDEKELVFQGGKWVPQAQPKKGTPAGELALIRREMDNKKYASVLKHAKRFLKSYPRNPLREQVLALAGDAELRRGRYWQAYGWYEKQIAAFPNGAMLERALAREMEVAEAFLAGKKRIVGKVLRLPAEQDGIEILERIAEHAPGTARAEVAMLMIGDHYFGKGDWVSAAEAYDNFLKLFSKSPRSAHAEFRSAEALWRSYRGPEWDDTPLIEAEQRYRAFAERRPAAARQAQVRRILREIHSARAAKHYEVGRFYGRTGKPISAAYYFRLVVRDYGDTEWAKRAAKRLEKMPPAGKAPRVFKPAPTSLPAEDKTPKEAR